jgi:membrane dipeptidase
MMLIDAHLDLGWNALGWNRDLTLPVPEIRRSEAGLRGKARGKNTVSLPAMSEGEMAVCLGTVLARAKQRGSPDEPGLDYRSQEIAYAVAQGQLAYYKMLESQGLLRMVRDGRELAAHLDAYKTAPLPGLILAMEGADPIVTPSRVPEWWADGLRVVGITHYGPNPYGHGTASDGGLTPKGRDLLKALADAGMILDVTHLADKSFWEAVELWQGTLLASHQNCRARVPGERQFSDDQIRYLIERDSVLGAALDVWMLTPEWKEGMTVSLEAAAVHIDHICQMAGNARHSAIGTDLDGGFGTEQSPSEIDTIADVRKLADILRRRGYREQDVEAIFYGNWVRLFRKAWKSDQS